MPMMEWHAAPAFFQSKFEPSNGPRYPEKLYPIQESWKAQSRQHNKTQVSLFNSMEFVLHYNTLQDSILTLVGGVLYIISGSATINYYKILVRRGSGTEKMKIQFYLLLLYPKMQGKYQITIFFFKKIAFLSKISILLLKNQLVAKSAIFYIFLAFLDIEA